MLRWNLFPWSLVYSNFSLLHISVCSLYWIYYKMLSVHPTGYIQEASKQVRGVVVQSEIFSSKRERARDSSQHFAMPWQVIHEIASEKWAQKFHTAACLQMPPSPPSEKKSGDFFSEGGGRSVHRLPYWWHNTIQIKPRLFKYRIALPTGSRG